MAGPLTTGHIFTTHSILTLLTILATSASPTLALNLPSARSNTCPSSSQKCNGAGLPDSFCCSSSSTCVTIDSGSSVICCPKGQNCTYIEPITCDLTKQDASLFPDNVIKTTRLDDQLPTCGDSCCPFGYICQGSFCAMEESESSTSTQTRTTKEATMTSTSTSTESSTTTALETPFTSPDISDEPSPTTLPEASITVFTGEPGPLSTSYIRYSSAADNDNLDAAETSCPAFPTNAILAGFFPGSVFGAVAGLLVTFCIRRHRRNSLPPSTKVAQNTYRNSTGTLIGISDPIPSDESAFRTDFLLRTNPKRHSEGARSVLSRSRSRVKSLFKPHAAQADKVPPLPMTPRRQLQRQPSMESIRVYTPPGVFANPGALNTASFPNHRPNTTLTEIMDQAHGAANNSVNGSGSRTSTNAGSSSSNQRFLLAPPPKFSRRTLTPRY